MHILALPDIHGDPENVNHIAADLSAADVVLLVGDLTNFGNRRKAARIVKAVQRHAHRVLAVPGNCDPPAVSNYLTQNEINLHGRCEVIEGLAFVGLGGSLPCPRPTANEFTEQELAGLLEQAMAHVPPSAPVVLVTHQPPFNTAADRIGSGLHVGSQAIRAWIEAHQPLICFTGHIHESAGTDQIGRTQVINPGPFHKGRYAYAQVTEQICHVEIRTI